MGISIKDVPEIVSISLLSIVLSLPLLGLSAPIYISSGVLATLVARLVGYWSTRATTGLSTIEKQSIAELKRKGSQMSYDAYKDLLKEIVANYTADDLLQSLVSKKAVKDFRTKAGARSVKLRFRARFL